MHPLEQEIYTIVTREALVQKNSTVVIGVSGGGDSIALLHILAALRERLQLTLVPVYIDHGLRPKEIPQEHSLVASVAKQYDLIFESLQVAVKEASLHNRQSLEQAARNLRYQALFSIKKQYDADCIAVAHTADDQVEEVLHRFLRGSSRKAVSGMAMKNNEIIRPLLTTTKDHLLAYLQEKNFSYCFDTSNDDLSFLRNRIRHELLPFLESKYNPGIRKALLKTAGNLGMDEELLEGLVDDAWKRVIVPDEEVDSNEPRVYVRRALFVQLHPALQRRIIERLLWSIGSLAQHEHIISVIQAAQAKKSGTELHLHRGLRALISRDLVTFCFPQGKIAWRGTANSHFS